MGMKEAERWGVGRWEVGRWQVGRWEVRFRGKREKWDRWDTGLGPQLALSAGLGGACGGALEDLCAGYARSPVAEPLPALPARPHPTCVFVRLRARCPDLYVCPRLASGVGG